MTAITREYLDTLYCDRQATEDAVPDLIAALRRVLDLCDDASDDPSGEVPLDLLLAALAGTQTEQVDS